jgi:hypothetical protein
VTNVIKSKPGLTSASNLAIPQDWDQRWFKNFISQQLQGADVRNAVGASGILVTGNITSPYATIGFGAPVSLPGPVTISGGSPSLTVTGSTVLASTTISALTVTGATTLTPTVHINGPDNLEFLDLNATPGFTSGIYMGFSSASSLKGAIGMGPILGGGVGVNDLALYTTVGGVIVNAPTGMTIETPTSGNSLTVNCAAFEGVLFNGGGTCLVQITDTTQPVFRMYDGTETVDLTMSSHQGVLRTLGAHALLLLTNNTTRITIDSIGAVSISAPTSGNTALTVNANAFYGITVNTNDSHPALFANGPASTQIEVWQMEQSGHTAWLTYQPSGNNDCRLYNSSVGDAMIWASTGQVTLNATAAPHLYISESGGIPTLQLANAGGVGAAIKFLGSSAAQGYNFLIGNQYNVSGWLEITPSTAAGGSTFTTPMIELNPAARTTFFLAPTSGFNPVDATANHANAYVARMNDGSAALSVLGTAATQTAIWELAQSGQTAWMMYQTASDNSIRLWNASSGDTIICHNNGQVYIPAATGALPGNDGTLTVYGSASNYTASFYGSSTSGGSLGVHIAAGTTVADYAFVVANQPSNTNYFLVQGLGAIFVPSIGTTASAANAFINSASSPVNSLLRSTSSIRYKTNVVSVVPTVALPTAPLAVPAASTAVAAMPGFVQPVASPAANPVTALLMAMRPVTYTSLSHDDDPTTQHLGFIAEEMDLIDKRLVHYNATPQPESVQYERVTVLLVAYIQQLEKRLAAAGIK